MWSSEILRHVPRMICNFITIFQQARRQGGFEGGCSNLPFTSKRCYIHRLTVHFKCPTVTSLAAIENHRCPNESGCNYTSLFIEDLRGTCAKAIYAAAIKDARKYVRK